MYRHVKKALTALLASAVITVVASMSGAAPAAVAASDDAAFRNTPAGVWEITLTRPGAQYGAIFSFTHRGKTACSGDGARGTWWHTHGKQFSYHMVALINNPDGTPFGRVEINQDAVLDGSTYAGHGTHYVYTAAGDLFATVEATITGVRSTLPAPC